MKIGNLWKRQESQEQSADSRSTVKIRDLLPIGSVVRLKDGEKRLMITGILQRDDSGRGKDYDYLGVLYPEGHIGAEYQYLFNHTDIEEVIFRGFADAERAAFLEGLAGMCER